MKTIITVLFTLAISMSSANVTAESMNYNLEDFAGDYQLITEQSDFITEEESMIEFTLEDEEFIEEVKDKLIPQLDLEIEESGAVAPNIYMIKDDGTTAWKGKNGAGEEVVRDYAVVYEQSNEEIPLFISNSSDEESLHGLIFDQKYLYYVTIVDQAALEGEVEAEQWFEWRIYEREDEELVNDQLEEPLIDWEEYFENTKKDDGNPSS